MSGEPMRPARGGRYDPYDPRHPMWTDPFWAAYCVNPQRAAAEQDPAGWPSRAAAGRPNLAGPGVPTGD